MELMIRSHVKKINYFLTLRCRCARWPELFILISASIGGSTNGDEVTQ